MKRILCDEMCSELGRWLRTAGYDTAIIDTPMEDQKIFEKAIKEKRVLISRDKYFKKIDPERKIVIFLKSESLDDWAQQLKEEGIDWQFCPFSRCLQCNSPLEKVIPSIDRQEKIPKDVKECWSCPTCGHIFWMGSHTERMAKQLQKWADGRPL